MPARDVSDGRRYTSGSSLDYIMGETPMPPRHHEPAPQQPLNTDRRDLHGSCPEQIGLFLPTPLPSELGHDGKEGSARMRQRHGANFGVIETRKERVRKRELQTDFRRYHYQHGSPKPGIRGDASQLRQREERQHPRGHAREPRIPAQRRTQFIKYDTDREWRQSEKQSKSAGHQTLRPNSGGKKDHEIPPKMEPAEMNEVPRPESPIFAGLNC